MRRDTFTLVQSVDNPYDRVFAAIIVQSIRDYLFYRQGRQPHGMRVSDGPKAEQFLLDLGLLDDAGEVRVPEGGVF